LSLSAMKRDSKRQKEAAVVNRRVHFLFAGVCTLTASAAYGGAGCSSSSGGPPAGGTDAGVVDTGRGFDAAESDSGSAPAGSASPPEAAADSSVPAPEAGLPESGAESGAEGGVDAASEASDAAGPADASEGGATCADDLSNIGTADFTIAFSLNQRSACTFSMLWDVRVSSGVRRAPASSTGDRRLRSHGRHGRSRGDARERMHLKPRPGRRRSGWWLRTDPPRPAVPQRSRASEATRGGARLAAASGVE
jgi:hypothetical protein